MRLAALMGLPVTYVWTHDSIGLGEDGPTHQPIEHLAALRAIPGLDVVRPGRRQRDRRLLADDPRAHRPARPALVPDPAERARSSRAARTASPTPATCTAAATSCSTPRAALPDVVLVGTGSEVQLAVEARELLAADGVRARVVSMPCREWFDAQEASYRETVIPPTVKARVSVEAGVAQGWREVVGDHGRIVSLEHYGASADYARIYQEFGITAEAVADAAHDSIRRPPTDAVRPPHPRRNTMTDRLKQLCRRGSVDLARRPVPRAHRDRQPRRPGQEQARGRRDHQPDDLRRRRSPTASATTTQVRELVGDGADVDQVVFELTTDDVRNACDVLRPVVRRDRRRRRPGLDRGRARPGPRHRGAPSPRRRALWTAVDRPNLLIKIPGHQGGLPGDHRDHRRGHQRQRDPDLRPRAGTAT